MGREARCPPAQLSSVPGWYRTFTGSTLWGSLGHFSIGTKPFVAVANTPDESSISRCRKTACCFRLILARHCSVLGESCAEAPQQTEPCDHFSCCHRVLLKRLGGTPFILAVVPPTKALSCTPPLSDLNIVPHLLKLTLCSGSTLNAGKPCYPELNCFCN